MADETAVELTSCVLHLREVFVFIPPKRTTAASWAAASFGIDKPLFTGELKIMTHDDKAEMVVSIKDKLRRPMLTDRSFPSHLKEQVDDRTE